MSPEVKECAQCGWDLSKNAPPETDPGDTKARVGVAVGLFAAYGVMWSLIGASTPQYAMPPRVQQIAAVTEAIPEPVEEPVRQPSIAIGSLPTATVIEGPVPAKPAALVSIKVADTKGAVVSARDALQYAFELPETEQKCRLVGWTKGIGGFGRNIEVFLLTDDEYVFWHANPVAIAQSSWETKRGSENDLGYDLSGAGRYHFIISNVMSSTPQTMAVKAAVKCTR